jgi:hypothetical protein
VSLEIILGSEDQLTVLQMFGFGQDFRDLSESSPPLALNIYAILADKSLSVDLCGH